jgi:hypothetical protein
VRVDDFPQGPLYVLIEDDDLRFYAGFRFRPRTSRIAGLNLANRINDTLRIIRAADTRSDTEPGGLELDWWHPGLDQDAPSSAIPAALGRFATIVAAALKTDTRGIVETRTRELRSRSSAPAWSTGRPASSLANLLAGRTLPVTIEEVSSVMEAVHQRTILSKDGSDVGLPDTESVAFGRQSLDAFGDDQALHAFVDALLAGRNGEPGTVYVLSEERTLEAHDPKPVAKIEASTLGSVLAYIREWGQLRAYWVFDGADTVLTFHGSGVLYWNRDPEQPVAGSRPTRRRPARRAPDA